MKLFIVLSLLVVVSHQFAVKKVEAGNNLRIINGGEIAPSLVPYQVYVLVIPPFYPLNPQDRWSCGGILITSKYVLTTARCVTGSNVITPIAGVDNPRNWRDGQMFNLFNTTTIIHEDYDPAILDNNLALIEVPGFEFNEKVQPAPLPSRDDINMELVGLDAMMTGFSTDSRTEANLTAVNGTILSNEECGEVYSFVRDSEMCVSGVGQKRACDKDEGGPVTVGNVVRGMISFRNVTCQSALPTVAVRISSYLDWIEKNSDWKP